MPIYMNFEGIKGSVTEKGHEGWIELDSCQMGGQRNVKDPTGAGVNRDAAAPSISELVVTKYTDDASTELFRASLWGDARKGTIDFCKTDGKGEVYLQVELEHVLIANYSVSGHGGVSNARPRESLTLNFTKITFNQAPVKNKAMHALLDQSLRKAAAIA